MSATTVVRLTYTGEFAMCDIHGNCMQTLRCNLCDFQVHSIDDFFVVGAICLPVALDAALYQKECCEKNSYCYSLTLFDHVRPVKWPGEYFAKEWSD